MRKATESVNVIKKKVQFDEHNKKLHFLKIKTKRERKYK